MRRSAVAKSCIAAILALGCQRREPPEVTLARSTAMSRRSQIASLETLIAQAEKGELVTSDQIAIGISEDVVKTLLNASLPQEVVVAGRLRVRIESALPFFRGNKAGLLFRAKASSVNVPGASATVELGGGLEEFRLENGKLLTRVSLAHFAVLESSLGDIASDALDGLLRANSATIQDAIPPLEIPVQHRAVDQDRGADRGRGGREARRAPPPYRSEPRDPGQPAVVGPAAGQGGPVAEAAAALRPKAADEAPRDRLRSRRGGRGCRRVRAGRSAACPLPRPKRSSRRFSSDATPCRNGSPKLIVANGEKSVAKAPRGGVMIGIPTSFTRSILEQVVTGLFSEMTLTLKNLKVHKEGQVRVKMLVAKRTVGKFVLDVKIHQVQGVLRPGKPDVVFDQNRVSVSLPVTLAEGAGNADIRLQWDSKGLAANVVCGDVDVNKSVTGGVVPQDYRLAGAFKIASAGSSITLSPDFPKELQVRIFVDPSEQAWQAVEEVMKEQRAGCEKTLEKIDMKEILGQPRRPGLQRQDPPEADQARAPSRRPEAVPGNPGVEGRPAGEAHRPSRGRRSAVVRGRDRPRSDEEGRQQVRRLKEEEGWGADADSCNTAGSGARCRSFVRVRTGAGATGLLAEPDRGQRRAAGLRPLQRGHRLQ